VAAGARRRRSWWRVLLVVVLATHVVVAGGMLWEKPDLSDQGVYLSTACFAADGVVPGFRLPKRSGSEPSGRRPHLVTCRPAVVHRTVWGIGRLAAVSLLVILAARRDRLPVGGAAASILLVAPVPANYVFPLACVLLAVGKAVPRYSAAFACWPSPSGSAGSTTIRFRHDPTTSPY